MNLLIMEVKLKSRRRTISFWTVDHKKQLPSREAALERTAAPANSPSWFN